MLCVLLMLLGCGRGKPSDTAQDSGTPTKAAVPLVPGALGDACASLPAPSDARALAFSGAPPKNLIVISIDTLRKDWVGRYSGIDRTPFLDARLEEAVVLDDLMACANWTLPGVYCAVTGHAMVDAGMEPLDPERIEDPSYFSPQLDTLASRLSAAGWATALVTTSKLFSTLMPTGNGFQTSFFEANARADVIVDEALSATAALQATSGAPPWYLQVHFRDPHSPYAPPSAYQGDLAGQDLRPYDPRTDDGMISIIGAWEGMAPAERDALQANIETLYDGELRYLDDQLSRLWQGWEDAGVLDDALVVFWSDHGEQFFERGGFQHGKALNQEEARAVGAFWARNLSAASFTGPTTHTDIPATILDVYGLPLDDTFTGVPLGALSDRFRTQVARDKESVPLLSVDRAGHRMLYAWDGRRAYYQTPDDPLEATDRYDADDESVGCLWDALAPVGAKFDDSVVGPAVDFGP